MSATVKYGLICAFVSRIDAAVNCYGMNGSISTTTCNSLSDEPVCLVCPDFQSSHILWYIGRREVAIGNHVLGQTKDVRVNSCYGRRSTLSLNHCQLGMKSLIRCQLGQIRQLAEFRVECKDPCNYFISCQTRTRYLL